MSNSWYGIVLLGGPGSGKGTQAVLGVLAKGYMERGELVPDQVTEGMVRERLSRVDCKQGFILDGFPRTTPQAEALDAVLSELGMHLSRVPYLHVSDDILVERLSNRWTCRSCGAVFNKNTPPPRDGCKKENCDGDLYRRPDDSHRDIRVYEKQTAPLIVFYGKRGLIVEVSGEQDVEHVQLDLLHAVTKGAVKVRVPSVSDKEAADCEN